MGFTVNAELCTDACTACWRICREGGYQAAQAAIKQLGYSVE